MIQPPKHLDTIDELAQKAQTAFKKSKRTTGEIAEYWLGEDRLADDINDATESLIENESNPHKELEDFIEFCESPRTVFLVKQTQPEAGFIETTFAVFDNAKEAIKCRNWHNKQYKDGENHFYTIEEISVQNKFTF